ncbi:protein EMSY-LIKE 4 [Momordica charantia]|uniref:Protein EMSY-LIKE 4 n=1 Tax=Momordica charantia TaxID=3673 RepID=A0A6J1CTI9_MOMCH|nr:protein EMSY-LIKE 4 [Momordica charantia]
MDYEPYDSSGTDDDLPPSHQNRIARGGGRVSGNGRSVMGSVPYPRIYGETDMEAQIHQLEKEAYSSVLRAFKAQADALTWDKEGLITELRKELRLSNEEHRELLGRVNADDMIRSIREWRQAGGHQPGKLSTSQAIHDPIPSPTVSASRKKQKITHLVPPQSFTGPSPSFHQQNVAPPHQPSSSVAKRGAIPTTKGKKQKSILPGASSAKQYQASVPSGRNQVANRVSSGAIEPADGATLNPLIGRKVRTRWPDDNNFYEAVITDYNAAEGRHALVYDMGSAKETWEWVNLSEISSEDIQWVDEDPGVPHRGGYGGSGHGMNRSVGRDGVAGAGRGRGVAKSQSRKDFLPAQNGIGKKTSDDIRILHTETLIREVERVFGSNHPDPVEVERAKKVLNDHEQSLIDAINRLGDISDAGSDEGGHRFSHGQSMDRE